MAYRAPWPRQNLLSNLPEPFTGIVLPLNLASKDSLAPGNYSRKPYKARAYQVEPE